MTEPIPEEPSYTPEEIEAMEVAARRRRTDRRSAFWFTVVSLAVAVPFGLLLGADGAVGFVLGLVGGVASIAGLWGFVVLFSDGFRKHGKDPVRTIRGMMTLAFKPVLLIMSLAFAVWLGRDAISCYVAGCTLVYCWAIGWVHARG